MKTKEQQQRERKRICSIAWLKASRTVLTKPMSGTRKQIYREDGECLTSYAFELAVMKGELKRERVRVENASYKYEETRKEDVSEIDTKLMFAEGFEYNEHDGYEPKEEEAKMSTRVTPKFTPKFTLQENAIKQCLIEKGYELTALPELDSGRPSLKSKVKVSMLEKPELFSAASFIKAWQRLLDSDEIVYEPYTTKKV